MSNDEQLGWPFSPHKMVRAVRCSTPKGLLSRCLLALTQGIYGKLGLVDSIAWKPPTHDAPAMITPVSRSKNDFFCEENHWCIGFRWWILSKKKCCELVITRQNDLTDLTNQKSCLVKNKTLCFRQELSWIHSAWEDSCLTLRSIGMRYSLLNSWNGFVPHREFTWSHVQQLP